MTKDRPLAVDVRGLGKDFGQTRALDELDLAVPAGCVYGVLGPNGAGKTTLIRVLATLLRPDRGSARVLGHDVVAEAAAVRRLISLTGQFAAVDLDLTAAENLDLHARLRGLSRREAPARAAELLTQFELSDAAQRAVKTFSGGMRRRLDLALSLVVRPRLLVLDEPTTGLDPRSRLGVWQGVREVVAAGSTVLLTTQHLDEADRLADRVAVVDHGRVIAEGSPRELKASVGAATLEVQLADPAEGRLAALILGPAIVGPVRFGPSGASLGGTLRHVGAAAAALAQLDGSGIEVTAFAVGQPHLDDVFLALTGRAAEQPEAA